MHLKLRQKWNQPPPQAAVKRVRDSCNLLINKLLYQIGIGR